MVGRHRAGRRATRPVVVAAAIAAVAVNLRCAVTSLGAVLGEVTAGWPAPGVVAGVLTALPALVFALVGYHTPSLARRFGPERLAAAAMVLACAGLTARALTGWLALFVTGTVAALAGAGIGNVLMPALVKRYFPTRTGPLTALYTTALAVGMSGGAALTGPAERALGGGWQTGLGMWAGLALAAAPPWLAISSRVGATEWSATDGTGARHAEAVSVAALWRSRRARALTVFFGCQSLNAYVVLGWLPSILIATGRDARAASLPLALVAAVSVPMSMALPALAARRREQRGLVGLTTLCYAAGYLGLLVAVELIGRVGGVGGVTGAGGASPRAWVGALGWVSAALLGAGNGAFPLSVTLLGLRTTRAELTAALSALAQSGGYLLAATGPLLVGVLRQASGGWRLPLLVVLATLVAQLLSGWSAARPGTVEAELGAAPRGQVGAPGRTRRIDRFN